MEDRQESAFIVWNVWVAEFWHGLPDIQNIVTYGNWKQTHASIPWMDIFLVGKNQPIIDVISLDWRELTFSLSGSSHVPLTTQTKDLNAA